MSNHFKASVAEPAPEVTLKRPKFHIQDWPAVSSFIKQQLNDEDFTTPNPIPNVQQSNQWTCPGCGSNMNSIHAWNHKLMCVAYNARITQLLQPQQPKIQHLPTPEKTKGLIGILEYNPTNTDRSPSIESPLVSQP